ncbi:MAG: sulfatase [Candidatus Sumerlaeota bacterium]
MKFSRRNFTKLGAGAVGASLFMRNALSGPQDEKENAMAAAPSANKHDYDLPEGDHDALRAKMKETRRRDPRPNVLWIFTDQQQWDLMSCAGNKNVNTPQIDRLARVGVRFENAYCPSPVCGPSRGSMVTGRMPHDTRVFHNGDPLSEDVQTMGEVLRENGYRTWWSGKWHIPEPRLYVDGDVRGFRNFPLPEGLPKTFLGDCQDMLFAGRAHDHLVWHAGLFPQPWFHAVSLINPHDICYWFQTNRDWAVGYQLDQYENMDQMPPAPENTAIPEDEPEALSAGKGARKQRPDAVWRAYNADYAAMTETVDRAVGMVLEGARKGGWLENTLIIFTSDHGDGGGSHQWTGKLSCYEEAAKVPMIVVPPGGLAEGRVDSESLVSGLDIASTVYDYAAVPNPPLCHGLSLRGALEKKGKVERDYVVMHIAPGRRKHPEQRKIEGRMVRSARYKYVAFNWGKNPEQFFDLENDPGELKNLASDAEYADVIKEHRAMLEEWKKATGDPFEIQ